MELKSFLKIINKLNSVGPNPKFASTHIILAYIVIATNKIGRVRLSKVIGIGEGSVRTLLKILVKLNLITITTEGCELTNNGIKLYEELKNIISEWKELPVGKLTIDKHNIIIKVRNCGHLIKHGIIERDAGIVVGATGIISLIVKNNKFCIPGGSNNCEKEYPDIIWDELKTKFILSNNDVIIISGSKDIHSAIYGAIAGSLKLIYKKLEV